MEKNLSPRTIPLSPAERVSRFHYDPNELDKKQAWQQEDRFSDKTVHQNLCEAKRIRISESK